MSSTKRRRLSISQSSSPPLHIYHLPDAVFVNISSYLALPSRALLAVALTTDSANYKKINWITQTPLLRWLGERGRMKKKQPSSATTSIVKASEWDVLDSGEIELELAARLSDDDIGAVLSCTNAVIHLKKLNMFGLVSIKGRGLEPLHGSVVLKRIDIELIRSSHIDERIVIPILDSILAHGNIMFIGLPIEFYKYGDECDNYTPYSIADYAKRDYVNAFEERFTQYLLAHRVQCNSCHGNLTGHDHTEVQDHMCSECLSYFCAEEEEYECNDRVTFCSDCVKPTCSTCSSKLDCRLCGELLCKTCRKEKFCNTCEKTVCHKCYETCKHCNQQGCTQCLGFERCDNEECGKSHCLGCFRPRTNRNVSFCQYRHTYCFECCFTECSVDWNDACQNCLNMIEIGPQTAKLLQKEQDKSNAEKKKLAVENDRLLEVSKKYNKMCLSMREVKLCADVALDM